MTTAEKITAKVGGVSKDSPDPRYERVVKLCRRLGVFVYRDGYFPSPTIYQFQDASWMHLDWDNDVFMPLTSDEGQQCLDNDEFCDHPYPDGWCDCKEENYEKAD